MLNVNHLIALLIIFLVSVILGVIIRVAYNSDKERNLLIRLKSLFVLQIIIPIMLPFSLKKYRFKYIKAIENDEQISEERRERLLFMLKDDEGFNKLVHYSIYGYFINFKDLLDINIDNLNSYRREKGSELNIGVKITFSSLSNLFIISNLFIQPKYFENIFKESN